MRGVNHQNRRTKQEQRLACLIYALQEGGRRGQCIRGAGGLLSVSHHIGCNGSRVVATVNLSTRYSPISSIRAFSATKV